MSKPRRPKGKKKLSEKGTHKMVRPVGRKTALFGRVLRETCPVCGAVPPLKLKFKSGFKKPIFAYCPCGKRIRKVTFGEWDKHQQHLFD